MLTLPQVREAMIGALANCQGDIAYFQQVLGDGEPGEKRHARRMLAVLSELECCDIDGKRQEHGLRVTFSDGSQWEFLVHQIDQAQ